MTDTENRRAAAFARIDALNAEDPNLERDPATGADVAKELLYGQRMSARLAEFMPDASDAVQIACRAQHLARFRVPRSDYPMDRPGYLKWRSGLAKMHAELVSEVVRAVGYDEAFAERVHTIVRKKGIATDAEVQTLEDVACLVFLEHYALPFAGQHPEEKVISILQKTWRKMSDEGHAAALALTLPDAVRALVDKALAPG